MDALAYLSIIVIEYLGLGRELPVLNAIHYSLGVSFLLVLYVSMKYAIGDFMRFRQAKLLAVFILLTVVSTTYAYVTLYAVETLKPLIGYYLLLFSGFFILQNERRIRLLLTLLVFSHAWLVIQNQDRLTSDVRAGAFRGGYFLGDGNDFGWSLVITFPFAIYLFMRYRSALMRIALVAAMALFLAGIVGTQSRGASLAVGAGLLYYLLFISNRRLISATLISGIVVVVLSYAPEQYFSRMETLSNPEAESSAMGRIRAWQSATQMALDHPFTGVGAGNFSSAYGRFYFPEDASSRRWLSAHSIYFLVLGEYGFPGIVVMIWIIAANIRSNSASARMLTGVGGESRESVPHAWPLLLNMSIVGYMVGGMFLGGIKYPHLFVLTMLTMITRVLVGRSVQAATSDVIVPAGQGRGEARKERRIYEL